jgi:hypothetical protein
MSPCRKPARTATRAAIAAAHPPRAAGEIDGWPVRLTLRHAPWGYLAAIIGQAEVCWPILPGTEGGSGARYGGNLVPGSHGA